MQALTLLKERLWHRCFPVNLAKFLRIPFYRTLTGDCFCKDVIELVWSILWKTKPKLNLTLHKTWSFPWRISSVNITKSTENCKFGHIYSKNLSWKTSFFVQFQLSIFFITCFCNEQFYCQGYQLPSEKDCAVRAKLTSEWLCYGNQTCLFKRLMKQINKFYPSTKYEYEISKT